MSPDCDCPQPPGGKVSCGPNQMAICIVHQGELRALCVDVNVIPNNTDDLHAMIRRIIQRQETLQTTRLDFTFERVRGGRLQGEAMSQDGTTKMTFSLSVIRGRGRSR